MRSLSIEMLTLNWAPDVHYQQDQWVITPSGNLAQAKSTHVSGDTYDVTLWNESSAFGPAGPIGPQGPPGADGAIGPAGPQGPPGSTVATGVSVDPSGLVVVTTPNVQAALAQLDAEFVARKKLPAAPADGQLPAWNAASGQWQAVNPSGASQLAYAEIDDEAGTSVQSGLTADTAVTNCTIVVPASARPVYLSGFGTVRFTTVGAGTTTYATLKIVETANGTDTPVTIVTDLPFPNTGVDGTLVIPPTRLAASTVRARTFVLHVQPITGTCMIRNGQFGLRSGILAEAK